ncbi:hypothetical protein BLNAU_18601 [Blattamonas nauphoetae]|uniref:Uncharacterized protein n=1 Tax=Blattamonas nauphoetae TaxID=2049346 RepID=A0ABQ9X772_9EUKA|nr:hypothetical protein BLNAU_18601 [Blattamonas nauphoetae]
MPELHHNRLVIGSTFTAYSTPFPSCVTFRTCPKAPELIFFDLLSQIWQNRTCNDATTHQDAIFANIFLVLKHVVHAINSQGASTEQTVQSLNGTSGSDLSKLPDTNPLELLSFILSELFTLDPGTQQPFIDHTVSRGEAFTVFAAVNSLDHVVGRSITRIHSRPFNKPAARFALKSVKNVLRKRSFDVVGFQK